MRRAPGSQPIGPGIAVAGSVLFGLLAVRLAFAQTRWVVFIIGGALVCAVAGILGVETTLTAAFVVGLSVDAHYYLTTPLPPLWTGLTTPGALSVPLALVPGFLLLWRRALLNQATGTRLDWVRDLSGPMGWYLLASLLSIAFSPIRFAGICVVWQNLALFAILLIVVNIVDSQTKARAITDLLFLALLGQCLVFIAEITTGVKFNAVGRVEQMAADGGTVLHAASGTAAATTAGFAMFLDPLVILAYAFYRTEPASGRKSLYGALFILGAGVLALTLNRSTWLAMPLGLFVAERLVRRRGLVQENEKRQRGVSLAPIIVIGIFVLIAPLFQSIRKVKHEEDFQQRLDLMGPARAMILHHPLFGVGPGVYGYVLREYAAGHAGWLYIAHNDYLLIWAERGTISLLTWLLFLRAVGRELQATSRRRDRWDATIGVGAMAGFAMQLWEVFWTAGMSFPGYGVMYMILGVCAGLNRHVAIEEPVREPVLGREQARSMKRHASVAVPAAR